VELFLQRIYLRLAFQVYQEGGAEKSVLDFALRKAGVDTLAIIKANPKNEMLWEHLPNKLHMKPIEAKALGGNEHRVNEDDDNDRENEEEEEVEMLEGSGAEGADSCEGDEHSSGESSSDDTISHSDSDSVPAPTAAAPKSTAKPAPTAAAPKSTAKPAPTAAAPKSTAKPAPKAATPKSTAKTAQKDTALEFGSKRTSERKETKSLKRQQITGEVEKTKSGNTIKKNRVR